MKGCVNIVTCPRARSRRGSAAARLSSGALLAGALLVPAVAPAAGKCTVSLLGDLAVLMMDSRPTVTAKINGADVRMFIDSGAFYSFLTPPAAAKLKLRLSDMPKGFTVRGIGGEVAVSRATAELTLFDHAFKGVQFLVGGGDDDVGVDGVLGQNILWSGGDVEYDLANGKIRLMRSQDCGEKSFAYWAKPGTPTSSIEIPWTGEHDKDTVGPAAINGHPVRVTFDTGALQTLVSRRALEKAGGSIDAPGAEEVSRVGGVGSRALRTWLVPVSSFAIGSEEIRNTKLRVIDYHGMADEEDMLLGIDFFLSHHIYVNGSQHRIYLTYNGGPVFDLSRAAASTPASQPGDAGKPPDGSEPPRLDAAGYARRGAASIERRDYVHALEDLDRACSMDPTQSEYFYERAIAHVYNSQPQPAAADLDTALRLKPDNLAALLHRSDLRSQAADRPGALADLDTADRIAAPDSNVHTDIAERYEALDELPKAIAEYDGWIPTHRLDSNRGPALSGRCRSRALLGVDLDKALADCESAVRLAPTSATFLRNRGLVQLRRGEFAKAVADYDAALAVRPKDAESLFGRGIARLRLGDAARGRADLEAAAEIDKQVAIAAKKHGIEP